MKSLKLITTLIALTISLGMTQAQTLRLHLKSGETLNYECAEVDSVVFDAPATPAGPTFTLECTDITMTSAKLKVTPGDNDTRYYFDIVTTEQLETEAGGIPSVVEGFIEYLLERFPSLSLSEILDMTLSQGYDEDEVTNIPAGTDFVFYAIAVDDNGKCYGEAATIPFSTPAGGNPADCTFDINYANLTTEGLTVKVTPSDPSIRYWMGITGVDEYPGDYAMMADVQSSIESYAISYGMTVEEIVKRVTFTGESTTEESGLSADTDYYIYVYAMDETGGNAGSMYKKKFTTPLTDYSNADIRLSYRYFNGNDLYDTDPDAYASLKDRVFVQIAISPNEYAQSWVVGLAQGDLTDDITYPDESTKNALLQGGFLNITSKNMIADWKTCTFLYFAADAAGIDGELHRLLVTFTPENARPISELSITTNGTDTTAKTMRTPTALPKASTVSKRMRQNKAKTTHRTIL